MISPLAYVDPNAQLGQNVEVGPFAYIEKGVVIGDNCVIKAHANILEGTTMGTGNIVYQNAVIGATPQDFHYVEGTPSKVVIGNNNHIRENVVIAGSSYNHWRQQLYNGSRTHLPRRTRVQQMRNRHWRLHCW